MNAWALDPVAIVVGYDYSNERPVTIAELARVNEGVPNMNIGRRFRRLTLTSAGAVAAALLVASVGYACTNPSGATFFSDGTISKSVTKGARISAFAMNAVPGVNYELVIGSNTAHPTHACHEKDFLVNPNIRRATSDGFIGITSGPAGDATVPSGTYQVCFRDTAANTATAAATLTLL